MGILGGSRIDGLTVFLLISLILYTVLVSGVLATFTSSTFIDPYGGKSLEIDLGEEYEVNDFGNVSLGGLLQEGTRFEGLTPDRLCRWYVGFFEDNHFVINSYGKNWWDSWTMFKLEPEKMYENEIEELYDYEKNYTKVIYNQGGEFETHVFFSPLFYYNDTSEEITYLNTTIHESIDNELITVVMATNQTYSNIYDIGKIFGMLTGFSTYSMPTEISVIVSGIFWGLLILTAVKLVVG